MTTISHDDMQFGYMLGKSTTDAKFVVKQLHEKYRAKGKKVYFGFIDLAKAFHKVPRELIYWAMHKLGVNEWLIAD